MVERSTFFRNLQLLSVAARRLFTDHDDRIAELEENGGGEGGGAEIVVSDGNNEDPTTLLTIGSGLAYEDVGDGEVKIDGAHVGVGVTPSGEPSHPDLKTLVVGYGLAVSDDSTADFTVVLFDSPLEVRDQDEGVVEKATGWVFGPGFTVEEGAFADQAVVAYEGSNLMVDGKGPVTEIQLGEGLEAEEVEPGVVLLKLST
jgi:hypothetical protein